MYLRSALAAPLFCAIFSAVAPADEPPPALVLKLGEKIGETQQTLRLAEQWIVLSSDAKTKEEFTKLKARADKTIADARKSVTETAKIADSLTELGAIEKEIELAHFSAQPKTTAAGPAVEAAQPFLQPDFPAVEALDPSEAAARRMLFPLLRAARENPGLIDSLTARFRTAYPQGIGMDIQKRMMEGMKKINANETARQAEAERLLKPQQPKK